MPGGDFDLERLLSPIVAADFFRDHWEKQPLLVSRKETGYYDGLLSTADVEHVIAFSRPKFADSSAFSGEKTPEASFVQGWLADRPMPGGVRYPGIAELGQAYGRGKTVVIMSMQQRWRPIAALCRHFEAIFHFPVHANMYLTPPGAQGFDVHFDTHEVFVLQLEGAKTWRLYGAPRPLPLVDEKLNVPRNELGSPREIRLDAGDLLYIPRGFVHEAFTSDVRSLHLTVGVNIQRWSDLIHEALDDLSRRDERFRGSIPPGVLGGGSVPEGLEGRFRELLAIMARDGRIGEAILGLGDKFFGQLSALPDAHFSSSSEFETIDPGTVLEKSPGAICRVMSDGKWVTLEFPGGQVGGPIKIASALEFVAKAGRFAVGDLPEGLGDSGKLVLARRLLREGLLRVVGQPPTPRGEK